jgi:hypothetical protein
VTLNGTSAYAGRTDPPPLVAAAVGRCGRPAKPGSTCPARRRRVSCCAYSPPGSGRAVFSAAANVDVMTGDWTELATAGPFDLLVLDGGGQGKDGGPPVEQANWLRPGGGLVIDDFAPSDGWPPRYAGQVDRARLHWLRHPRLLATQVRIAPDMVTVIAAYPGPT